MNHLNWRGILARLPLPMLALAASYGVYEFARLYIGLAVVQVSADQRIVGHAQTVTGRTQ
jgi:hypothetical protein